MSRQRCRWHRRRVAVVSGTGTKLGYCKRCWPPDLPLPLRLLPDCTLWLAA